MREWVPVGRQGMSLDEYRAMSLHDRWWLHKETIEHLERFYGPARGLIPEE